MNSETWKKIKEKLKNAPPIAVIRTLHPIIRNKKIPISIRNEAKELANKARELLDSQKWWKSGVHILPSSSRQVPLERAVEGRPAAENLEKRVEGAAPSTPKENSAMPSEYSGAVGGYVGKSYEDQGRQNMYSSEQQGRRVAEATATASEIASGEAEYTRKRAKEKSSY